MQLATPVEDIAENAVEKAHSWTESARLAQGQYPGTGTC